MELMSLSELTSPIFLSALLTIILIDLALAGDNAIVIALAARQVPLHMQRKVLIWGSVAAVVVRGIASIFVVWLLKIPGFLLVGGALLLYIAFKLVRPQRDEADTIQVSADASVRQAVMTIVLADIAMGIENVLAVGGAAHGNVLLVIIGLLISVPIIMFGSQLVLKLVGRFPHIITLGGAILAWTAVKMMLGEPMIKSWVADHRWITLPAYTLAIALVVLPVFWRRLSQSHKTQWFLLGFVIVWLGLFSILEERIVMHPMFEPGWHIGEEVVDFIMWLGWIPIAIWLQKRMNPSSNTK
ncbi:MAG: TerC family protein [Cytophagales bacterium]|nr:TerC family protein [Cytophagales bacterium]